MVMSPMHTDQLSVIEALAKSAPSEMIVVVKEHLPMLGRRPKSFYERIRQMPRVVVVSPSENGLELVKNSELVAVITGTAAWEAIRFGKPTLVVGDSPYLSIKKSATHEPCFSNLPAAIKKELEADRTTQEDIYIYIASLLSESFEMDSGILWGDYLSYPLDVREKVAKEISYWIDRRASEDFGALGK